MTHTALMVLPQHNVVKHNTNEVAEYEQELYDGEVPYGAEEVESYEDIVAETAALKLRYEADKERCDKFITTVTEANKDILAEINLLHAKLIRHQIDLEESDDLEDQANAADLKKTLGDHFEDEDTDHETRDNEDDADRMDDYERQTKAVIAKKCKKVYKAIARATHPDKCRHLPKAEAQRRNQLFIAAKDLLAKNDLDGLELIHVELYGKTLEPINLIQRLILARTKREEARIKFEELRESQEWRLYCIALRHGPNVAAEQYRMGLEQALTGLRQMVSDLENPQPDSNTHWV